MEEKFDNVLFADLTMIVWDVMTRMRDKGEASTAETIERAVFNAYTDHGFAEMRQVGYQVSQWVYRIYNAITPAFEELELSTDFDLVPYLLTLLRWDEVGRVKDITEALHPDKALNSAIYHFNAAPFPIEATPFLTSALDRISEASEALMVAYDQLPDCEAASELSTLDNSLMSIYALIKQYRDDAPLIRPREE